MSDHVLIEEQKTENGMTIGVLELNVPKTLNSLSLDMIRTLEQQLSKWEENANIALVILKGSGEKAFCAGGDVQQLYDSAISPPGGPCEYAETFFLEEYVLDFHIHKYPKPILCLGTGIVMGGGLGLMAGASHRVVSERSKLAMPEVTIGLYPDVGATCFLKKMPNHFGYFFALTGAVINANDAIKTGLADACISSDNIDRLLEQILATQWQSKEVENVALLDQVISELAINRDELKSLLPSNIEHHKDALEDICSKHSLGEWISAIEAYSSDDPWINKAKETLAAGSPFSTIMIFEQLTRHVSNDLRPAFISEYQLSTNMVRYPDFAEGVRALLIDKDKSPKWQHKHYSEIPTSLINKMFDAPWPSNPLEERI